jgi:tetratricopeptide (TPR) repeat protein
MEFFYNPDLMSEADIKATFVARQSLVDELVNLIKRQPDGAGIQHVVIIAPRGMGKTTVLLVIQFAVKDKGLSEQWQVVRFPEESYNIYDLSDFWLQILQHLATDTKDNELQQQIEKLPSEYPNNEDLQEVAYALIKDWRRKNKKRILILVDNFDQILQQINDERDNARLRDVLMNDGTIMLIGGATTFFHEARAYDQPLYNFFKIENLNDLSFEQMEELLIRRAELDGRKDFDKVLEKQRPKLRALEFFSGGNPRLVLMLYRVITSTKMNDVMDGLEKLLDEVTPYYKAKVEALPPQQRKILDLIARESSRTNEGLTPGEIAKQTRLSPNQASAQLKRLVETGHIRAANLRGRNTYYTLSEKLYAIWHQMRFGRNRREKLQWLVNALNAIFSLRELSDATSRLDTIFKEHFIKGQLKDARDTLEHQLLLTEAMPFSAVRSQTMEKIINHYLQIKEHSSLKEHLTQETLENLTFETVAELINNKCIDPAEIIKILESRGISQDEINNFAATFNSMAKNLEDDNYDGLLKKSELALKIGVKSSTLWFANGYALFNLKKYEKAIISFNKALEIKPDYYNALAYRGNAFLFLNDYENALIDCNQAISIDPKKANAWGLKSFFLLKEFSENLLDKKLDLAKQKWIETFNSVRRANFLEQVSESLNQVLINTAKVEDFDFVKDLISAMGEPNPFFALERAINYLQTKDETLIEKLSPEVRGVVEETIRFLQEKPANENQTSKKTNKQKRNGRVNKKANQKSLPDSRAEKKTT